MLTLLDVCLGLALTATLLSVATIFAAFELGRLVTRDDEQRQVEALIAPRIRDGVRPASARDVR